ncbi:MAG: ribonuclease D [Planctomycetia bacterium]|nr:MAG: ribonuclease D [Planctomycetia bacterium]
MAVPELITSQAELDSLCRQWRAAGRFAFDTEFIRDDTYDAALCLVQVADGQEVSLIDPTSGLDLAEFWELVCDPAILTIVHAGKEDFDLCLRIAGKPPRNVFDVQIAAGFVGLPYPMSLVRLVDHVLGKRLKKEQTLTDWLRRPLTNEQLTYAVDDVRHLPALHAKLSHRLGQQVRTEWAREEFARFEDPQHYRPPPQERAYRIKGATRLDPLGLAVLEGLIEWRDNWAREKNRPTRALIRDDVLCEIARRRPTQTSDLAVLRGFPQSRNPRILADVLRVIESARAIPPSELPAAVPLRDESPMEKATLDLVSAAMRGICFEEGVSQELVGSASRLRELLDSAREPGTAEQRPALLSGWRHDFIGRHLLALLDGRAQLHFSGWPGNPRIEIVAPGERAG